MHQHKVCKMPLRLCYLEVALPGWHTWTAAQVLAGARDKTNIACWFRFISAWHRAEIRQGSWNDKGQRSRWWLQRNIHMIRDLTLTGEGCTGAAQLVTSISFFTSFFPYYFQKLKKSREFGHFSGRIFCDNLYSVHFPPFLTSFLVGDKWWRSGGSKEKEVTEGAGG